MNPLIDLLTKFGGVFAAIAAVLALALGLGGEGSSMSSMSPSNPDTTNTIEEVEVEDIGNVIEDDPGENQATDETEELYGAVPPRPETVSETELLDAINAARADRGLNPLSLNAAFSKRAKELAVAQAEDGNSFANAQPIEGILGAASSLTYELNTTDAAPVIHEFTKTESQTVEHIYNPDATQVGIGMTSNELGRLTVHAYFL